MVFSRIPLFANLRRREDTPPAAPPQKPTPSPSPPPVPTTTEPTAMTSAPIRQKLNLLINELQKQSPDLDACNRQLIELKIALTTLPGLQPAVHMTEAFIPDVELARDVYEIAALYSLKKMDEDGFGRHVALAKSYYVDYTGVLPTSPRQNLIIGLHLTRLVAQDRIGEFHTELELVPSDARSHPFIEYPLNMVHYFMEGSYSKLRNMKVPDDYFNAFSDRMTKTLRDRFGDVSEKAYRSLSTEAALKMFSLSNEKELVEFCSVRGWRWVDGTVHFNDDLNAKPSAEEIPSAHMIQRSLEYAKELEQII